VLVVAAIVVAIAGAASIFALLVFCRDEVELGCLLVLEGREHDEVL
jgi:hypothetical protein